MRRSISVSYLRRGVAVISVSLACGCAISGNATAVDVTSESAELQAIQLTEPAGLAPADVNATRQVFPPPAHASIPASGSSRRREVPGTPVSLRSVRAWDVDVADRATAARLGISGVVVALRPTSFEPGSTEFVLDYSAFAGGGGGYASRLRLVRLPECAIQTPELPACQVATPLRSTNDEGNQQLTTSLTADAAVTSTATVLAATTASSGSSGDFSATSVAPSGTWSVGENSGAFQWSYPINIPEGPFGGPAVPNVALTYNSGAVDGKTAASNSQSSWIGEGWEYTPGFIERTYRPCVDDVGGPSNTHDLCWAGEIISLNWNGRTTPLVRDEASLPNEVWKLQQDDGTRVTRLTDTGPLHGPALYGEHWLLTDTDGTKFYFGRTYGPGRTTEAATDAVWTVPVYGARVGDPCHQATFAASHCDQGWRWNLDYVEDVNGNAALYQYVKETNYYGANELNTGVPYDRGGYLYKIWWGFHKVPNNATGSIYASPLQGRNRVEFTVAERCFNVTTTPVFTCTVDGSTGDLFDASNTHRWPDTPQDQDCNAGATCTNHAPSFWSRKRLVQITTGYYKTASSLIQIDRYTLNQEFPTSGEKALWLKSIDHTSFSESGTPTSDTMPPVTFSGALMTSRVVGLNNMPGLHHWRVNRITSETGQVVSVDYSAAECSSSNVPLTSNLAGNTKRCYPVYWTPPYQAEPILDFFHKYVVTKVTVSDVSGVSRSQVTGYSYPGSPAWHFDDNEVVKKANRSWGQWRGYQDVEIRTGDGNSSSTGTADKPTLVLKTFFRGMHDDYVNATTRRTIMVGHSPVTGVTDSPYYDREEYAGWLLEEQTFNGDTTERLSTVITDPILQATTAVRPRDTQIGSLNAAILRVRTQREYLPPFTAPRRTQTDYVYDNQGFETSKSQIGTAVASLCTTSEYETSATNNITVIARQRQFSQACPGPADGTTNLLSEAQYFYDGSSAADPTAQAAPVKGLLTRTQNRIEAAAPSRTTKNTYTYDEYGRQTSQTVFTSPTSSRTTSTSYIVDTSGTTDSLHVRQVTVTYPKLNPASTTEPARTSTQTLMLGRGLVLNELDESGSKTQAEYDAWGRVTKVWLPNQDPAVPAEPSVEYQYLVRQSGGPQALTTTRLVYPTTNSTDKVYRKEVALMDGMGQVVQTQTETESGGRIVSDTIYDSHGWPVRSNRGWVTSGPPTTTLVATQDSGIDDWTANTYDGAGRMLSSVRHRGREAVTADDTTTMTYGIDVIGSTNYDTVTQVGPKGAVAETVFTDVRGQRKQSRQYTSASLTGSAKSTTYNYDAFGRQTNMTGPPGPSGSTTASYNTSYNLAGWVVGKSDSDGGTRTLEYDDAGQLSGVSDPRGDAYKRTFAYDTLGRKVQEFHGTPGALAAEWSWDAPVVGRLGSTTRYSPAGSANPKYVTRITGYTKTGLPTSEQIEIPTAEGALAGTYVYETTYTPTDLPVSRTVPTVGGLPAETLATAYTKFGNPTTLTAGPETYVSGALYTSFDEVARLSLRGTANPAWVSFERDAQTRRLTRANLSVNAAQPQVADFSYKYDQAGNVLESVDVAGGGATAMTQRQCYEYDALRQMTQAWSASSSCATVPSTGVIGGPRKFWTSWQFDHDGGRLQQVERAVGGHVASTITTDYVNGGTGNPAHALASLTSTVGGVGTTRNYSYDAAGNTLTRGTAAGAQSFTWTADNLVASVSTGAQSSSYVYLADGSQVIRRDPDGATLFLPDGEVKRTTATGATVGTRFYSFGGVTVAVRVGSGAPKVQFADPNGSSLVSVDWTSNAATRRYMDPFGNQMGAVDGGAWPTARGFLQAPVNQVSGLTDMGARKYDPVIGRFMSVDPIIDPADPAQNNGYNYGFNNPLTNPDPSGLIPKLRDDQHWIPGRRPGTGRVVTDPKPTPKPAGGYTGRASSGKPGYGKWVEPGIPASEMLPVTQSEWRGGYYQQASMWNCSANPTSPMCMQPKDDWTNVLIRELGIQAGVAIVTLGTSLAVQAGVGAVRAAMGARALAEAGSAIAAAEDAGGAARVGRWMVRDELKDAKGFIGPGGHRNIPSDWVTRPSRGGRGQRYWDPNNSKGNYIRIEEDAINGRHVHVTSGGKQVLYNGDRHIPFDVWDKWATFGGP